MTPFLTVLALWHSKVHVYFPDSGDIASYVETLVNKTFNLTTTLNILNIQPNNDHI